MSQPHDADAAAARRWRGWVLIVTGLVVAWIVAACSAGEATIGHRRWLSSADAVCSRANATVAKATTVRAVGRASISEAAALSALRPGRPQDRAASVQLATQMRTLGQAILASHGGSRGSQRGGDAAAAFTFNAKALGLGACALDPTLRTGAEQTVQHGDLSLLGVTWWCDKGTALSTRQRAQVVAAISAFARDESTAPAETIAYRPVDQTGPPMTFWETLGTEQAILDSPTGRYCTSDPTVQTVDGRLFYFLIAQPQPLPTSNPAARALAVYLNQVRQANADGFRLHLVLREGGTKSHGWKIHHIAAMAPIMRADAQRLASITPPAGFGRAHRSLTRAIELLAALPVVEVQWLKGVIAISRAERDIRFLGESVRALRGHWTAQVVRRCTATGLPEPRWIAYQL